MKMPLELDMPAQFGFTMKGWDFSRDDVAAAITQHRMLNPAMELGTNVCPWNCSFCFTESPANPAGVKRRLHHEMALDQRLRLIDQAAALGARSINVVGAGEPTIDPDFWKLLVRMKERNITPIVYTEGSLKLTSRRFCEGLFEMGATVVLKVNSLYNEAYQNSVVQGSRPKPGIPTRSYFAGRQRALDMLIDTGFNASVPTRLAFDTIICHENLDEIEQIHRDARLQNIFVLFVNYLPSGRTKDGHTTAVSRDQQFAMFEKLARIDETEFGLKHATSFPYAGGVPCTIRGLGLFVKIEGDVFDCPGESMPLGNVREESLAQIWERARPITAAFDGGCFPREQFWKTHNVIPLRVVSGR
jgi:MoaA/NifB/PqqE/SkfB family radical SAM enzyme